LYINGVLVKDENSSGHLNRHIQTDNLRMVLGGDIDAQGGNNCGRVNNELKGKVDEFRISSGLRTADYAAATYFNQGDPSTYLSLGVQETQDEKNEEERKKLYESLSNLLKEETNFEEKMWKTTQKGKKVKAITINQKFKDSDIEEARYSDMMDYLRRYPKYASKSSFSTILNKITEIEKGIKKTKNEFHKAISDGTREISYFTRNLMEAKNNIRTYRRILKEGKEKLEDMRYRKGFFFKISSETSKLGVSLDTLNHKIDEKEDTIKQIEKEVNDAKKELAKLEK